MIYEEYERSLEKGSERKGDKGGRERRAVNEQLKVWSCRKNRGGQQKCGEGDNSISLKSEGIEAIY